LLPFGSVGSPRPHGIGTTLLPGFGKRRKVLAVRNIGHEESHHTTSDDIERVMTGIHDTTHSNKTCGEKGN
jgi:hypothetical protein